MATAAADELAEEEDPTVTTAKPNVDGKSREHPDGAGAVGEIIDVTACGRASTPAEAAMASNARARLLYMVMIRV